MELFLMSYTYLLLAFILTTVVILQILLHREHRSLLSPSNYNLPPGTLGWPFIGETLQFLSSGWNGHPQKFVLDRMARFSSECFKTSIVGAPVAFLCGAAGNKLLFSNEGKLVVATVPDSVKKMFPSTVSLEAMMRMKKLLPHFIKPEALRRYVGDMDAIAQTHIAFDWESHPHVTVFPLAKRFTFWVACRVFLNMNDMKQIEHLAEPFEHIVSGFLSFPIDLPGTQFNRAMKACRKVRNELMTIIRQRKQDMAENKLDMAGKDVLSHMLAFTDEDGQHMSELEIADKITSILVAGHDSTCSTITFVVKFLAEYPHVYELVHKEQMEISRSKAPGELLNWNDIEQMKYSWNVVCEVLRVLPVPQGNFREAMHDITYANFQIPKGWKLCWSPYSTHYDPKCFPEPEKFDPTRFEGKGPAPYTYVPFGGGPRMCPGKEYARLEILVFMHNIVKRFMWHKLMSEEKIAFNPLPIPSSGLPIRLTPHHI